MPVTHRPRCVTGVAAAILLAAPTPTFAQASGALDIVATVVEYDGFLVSGAGALSPWFRYNAGRFSLAGQGTWVTFESGNEIVDGNVAAGWLSPDWGGWRLEGSGTLGLAKYTEGSGTGHGLLRTRIHFQGDRGGAWAGVSTGVTGSADAATVWEAAAGAWRLERQWTLVGTATVTGVAGERYLDVTGTASWTGTRTTVDLRAGARPATSSSGVNAGDPRREAYAEASARIRFASHLEAILAAGHTPGDPVRNALGSDYISLGIRVNFARSRQTTLPIVAEALDRAARSIRESPDGSSARVEVAPGTLRLLIEGASTVEIMGDFTDWVPTALTRLPSGVWELPVRLNPGAHRLNVRIDGGPWAVPLGTRLEQTDFGGAVGVIVIP